MQTTYTFDRYKSKKAVKEAIASGERVEVYAPNPWGAYDTPPDGHHTICGPGPYERKWYGQVTVKSGVLTSIK
jgi:hypothetical protein